MMQFGGMQAHAGISEASPFAPVQEAGVVKETKGEYELSGVTKIGDKTMGCIEEVSKKKSRWISVGGKADGIELVSCDLAKGEAVVNAGGRQLVLLLRKSSTIKSPSVVSLPLSNETGPAGGKLPALVPLTTKEEQEREARMLVSDLLEIGMRQRKAYEEAQRKAGEDASKKPAVTPSK